MYGSVDIILVFFLFILPVLLLTSPLILCFIRFLNETWLDEEWRIKKRTPAEQAALLDWEASIRDFHLQQSALRSIAEEKKTEEQRPEHRIQLHGPSAFRERRRRF